MAPAQAWSSNTDADLDGEGRAFANKSSIRTLADTAASSFSALSRGPRSLPGLVEAEGYKSVPSPHNPGPGGGGYYSGGYDTRRHAVISLFMTHALENRERTCGRIYLDVL